MSEKVERIENSRGGHGFLNTENKLIFREGAMKVVPDGTCPCCEKDAPAWEPPRDDPRFVNRIETLREVYGLDEAGALKRHLTDEGGFIAICPSCQTAFWVPAHAAKIKE